MTGEQSKSYMNATGDKIWYLPSRSKNYLHRIDGPAIEYADGTKAWFVNGERHRVDGHAIEWADGTRSWYINGKLHRLDGPAVEHADGRKIWFIEDKNLPIKEVEAWIKENNIDLKTEAGQMAFKLRWS